MQKLIKIWKQPSKNGLGIACSEILDMYGMLLKKKKKKKKTSKETKNL